MVNGKVYLKSGETGLWYIGPAEWAEGCHGAIEFQTVTEAMRFGRGLAIKGLVVVLHYDDPACDLVLPVGD